jgi:hypothetical protein
MIFDEVNLEHSILLRYTYLFLFYTTTHRDKFLWIITKNLVNSVSKFTTTFEIVESHGQQNIISKVLTILFSYDLDLDLYLRYMLRYERDLCHFNQIY